MWTKIELNSGLYVVATPIGTARDITLRALDTLASCDLLAAEDTRVARHLLDLHGVPLAGRQIVSYHEHSSPKARQALVDAMKSGQSLAYVSDAGTPLVADPGFQLVQAALAEGIAVNAVPGASAPLVALTISGMPSDRFLFGGFLPSAKSARQKELRALSAVPATLIFFESPKRMGAFLADAAEVLGGTRRAAVARELTKKFEECRRGTLSELATHYAETAIKGECVVLIARAEASATPEADMVALLHRALQGQSLKNAVAEVAGITGLPRRQVYQAALDLEQDKT